MSNLFTRRQYLFSSLAVVLASRLGNSFRSVPVSTVTKMGIVYYADDPDKVVFRKVYPTADDRELNDQRWVTEGCDPSRCAIIETIDTISPHATVSVIGMP